MSFQRGSFRGRGGRGRGNQLAWRGAGGAAQAWVPETPPRPFGATIDSIDIKTLLVDEEEPKIQDVSYVASYNWLNSKSPVILVPGSPPAWTPPAEDIKLRWDSGDVFRDINAAHYPNYPLEPTLRSLLSLQPDFDLQSIDIIGCGSTIGNILRFAVSKPKPFRFDVDLLGDTLLFVRKEKSPTELIQDIKGYGHTFPESYTSWEPETRGSVSHQRIIQYNFGGLRFLIRSETDGYLRTPSSAPIPPAVDRASTTPLGLEEALATASMNISPPSGEQKLELETRGRRVPQDKIFDIKTRSSRNIFDMEEILPRLWVNQTPRFLLAYHEDGLFDRPKIRDIREEVLDWEKASSPSLARFHAIINRILDIIKDCEEPQAEISWDGQGPLKISKQIEEGQRALPSELHCYWEGS